MSLQERAEGMLPLKPLTFSVLVALEARPDYGYGIAKRVADPDGGAIRLAPSNMYHVLDRLIHSGLIEETAPVDGSDARRTYYSVTPLGRVVLQAEIARLRSVMSTASRLSLAKGDA